jgi:hypothetical protein
MSDTRSISPGCAFSRAGAAGPCTNAPGTLSYTCMCKKPILLAITPTLTTSEIIETIGRYAAVTLHNEDDAVEYAIFNDG